MFCGISTVVFLFKNSVGVFLLRVSGSVRFFLLSKLYVNLEISLKLVKIYRSMVWVGILWKKIYWFMVCK